MRKLLAALLILGIAPAAIADEEEAAQAHPPAAASAQEKAAPAGAPVAAPASPATTTPAAEEEVELTPGGKKRVTRSGFNIGVSVDHSVGQGTFENAASFAYVGGSLVVAPSYGFNVGEVKMGASANVSFSYEYTQPDNPTGRHWSYGDIGLGLSAPGLFKDEKFTGISLTPSVGLSAPVSIESRWRGVLTSMSARLGASRAFGKFFVGASFGASKTLYGELTRRFNEGDLSRRDEGENILFVCRTDSFNCGLAGVPSLWAMSGGINAGYSPIEKLNISMGFNLSKTYKYAVGVDEYSSQRLDSNGNPVVDDQGTMDMMMGSIGVSYQLTDALSASFGMGTVQPPKSADNQRFRFPFFALEGQELGYTSYSLTLSGSY